MSSLLKNLFNTFRNTVKQRLSSPLLTVMVLAKPTPSFAANKRFPQCGQVTFDSPGEQLRCLLHTEHDGKIATSAPIILGHSRIGEDLALACSSFFCNSITFTFRGYL